MMEHVISRFVLPPPRETAKQNLYLHIEQAVEIQNGRVLIPKGCKITLDSYFNGLFYTKYLEYTVIRKIFCVVRLEGYARINVRCMSVQGETEVPLSCCTQADSNRIELDEIDLTVLPPDGMLYLEVEALSDEVFFYGGFIQTRTAPQNYVRIAAVICTFKREEYVRNNIEYLKEAFFQAPDCPCPGCLDVFVIDNGKSLQMDSDENVKIFPNKNYGGSGGFTRGLIEAYDRKDTYSHVLFMDDDIEFEIEAIVKTIQLLRYAKILPKPICIGGQMLLQNVPTVQREAGSFFRNGRLAPVNKNLDLSVPENLLKNNREYHVQYNAWWYCCFPLSVVEKISLPLPFFIKIDDVEYGLRMNAHIVLMNGIGVWHQDFEQKYSAHLEYYIKRNELVVSALYCNGDGVRNGLKKMFRCAVKSMLMGTPKTIEFLIMAYRDFLKGPDFFLSLDDEELLQRLIACKNARQKSRIFSIVTDPFRLLPVIFSFVLHYSKVQRAFQLHMPELVAFPFWRKRLGLASKEEK